MVLAIALCSVVTVLLLLCMLYSKHMAYVPKHNVPIDMGVPKQSAPIDLAVPKGLRGIDVSPETERSRKSEPEKEHGISQSVRVSHVKTCPINQPAPLLVLFVDNLASNAPDLLKKAELTAGKVMPKTKGRKPAPIFTADGTLVFEAAGDDLPPKIKVELSFLDGTFKVDTKSIVKRLEKHGITEFRFLVTPVVATDLSILVRVKYMKKVTAGDKQSEEENELLVIDLPVKAKAFGILDARALWLVRWGVGAALVAATLALAVLKPEDRTAMLTLTGVNAVVYPVINGVIKEIKVPDFFDTAGATASKAPAAGT